MNDIIKLILDLRHLVHTENVSLPALPDLARKHQLGYFWQMLVH